MEDSVLKQKGMKKGITEEIATRKRALNFYSLANILPDPDIVLKKQGKDIRIYKELLCDPHVFACTQSRKAGVLSLDWEINRGLDKDQNAEDIENLLKKLDIQKLMSDILDATQFGFQPLEIIWKKDKSGHIMPERVTAKPPEWFCFDDDNNLKFRTTHYCMAKWQFLRDRDIPISAKCCQVMKKTPAKKFEKESGLKPFIATMAAESNLRKTEYLKKGCNSFNSDRPASTPLGFWTEQDIYHYIKEFDVPYCSVYGDILQDSKGKYYTTKVDRTGCMFCMFGVHREKSPNKFEKMRETHPKLHDYCINQLGCGKVLDFLGVKY